MIQPDGMFGFGEKKPAFDQQAHDTAHRRGKRRLPVRDADDKPRERQAEAERERYAAQAARVPPRQLEAEFTREKSTVRMADVEQARVRGGDRARAVHPLAHPDRPLEGQRLRTVLSRKHRIACAAVAIAAFTIMVLIPPWNRDLLASGVYKYAKDVENDFIVATNAARGSPQDAPGCAGGGG